MVVGVSLPEKCSSVTIYRPGRGLREERGILAEHMTDVLNSKQRSYCMSRIRGKNTQPERLVRRGLFALGFRYRLHRRELPGRPDLVFPMYRAVIFVNGCLWHGHRCHMFKWPTKRAEFWRNKILRNCEKDFNTRRELLKSGWRVMTVWECTLRGRMRRDADEVFSAIATWLRSDQQESEIECVTSPT